MKQLSYFFLFSVLTSFTKNQSDKIELQTDAIKVLEKTSTKLNSLKNISYTYYRSINYFSENYHSETAGTTFLDFDRADTLLGFKFQLENEQSKIVYNGAENFFLTKKDKTIKIVPAPKRNGFESLSFFLNSIITLKNSLPLIISDKEIQKTLSDTIIVKKKYYLVSLTLKNKTLSGLGSFSAISLKRDFLYRIVIDKNNYLPLHIIQTNNIEPKDYLLTSFTNIKPNDNLPSEFSWYYSTYSDYKPAADKKLELIKENSNAPIWKLPYYNNADSLHSTQLKNKYLLLEFWIKNCGYCIQAVPKLNNLIENNKAKSLEVIGINAYDSRNDISKFYEKNNPLFKTLSDENGKVTAAFGVDAFPQVVLINKEGKVLYAGSLDVDQLQKLFDSIL